MAAEGSEREHQGLRFGGMTAELRLWCCVVELLAALMVASMKRFSMVNSECWRNKSLSTGFAVDTFWNTFDADVVSYEKKRKPELSADHIDGLSAHNDSVIGGGSDSAGSKDQGW